MSSNETESSTLTASESFLAENFELIIYISVGIIALLFIILIVIIIYLIWRSKQQKKKKKLASAAAAAASNEKKKKESSSTSKASVAVNVSAVAAAESQEKVPKSRSKKKPKLLKKNNNESETSTIAAAAPAPPTPAPSKVAKEDIHRVDEEEETTAKESEQEPNFQDTKEIPLIDEKIKRKPKYFSKEQNPTTTADTVTKEPTTTITITCDDDGPEGKDIIPFWKYFEKEWARMKAEDAEDSTQKTYSIVSTTTTNEPENNQTKNLQKKDIMATVFHEMKMNYSTPVQQTPDDDEISLLKAPLSQAITKAETLSKTAEITAELQNCIIDSSTGLLVIPSKDERKWLNSGTTQAYIRLWAFTNEYKYLFTFNSSNEKEMKEKFERMSIPILYCYILNQSIPKSIKIMAMEIMRAKLKCMINSMTKETLKFPHPIPTMFKICAENPTILNDPEWNKYIIISDSKNN